MEEALQNSLLTGTLGKQMATNNIRLSAIGDIVFNNALSEKEQVWDPVLPFLHCKDILSKSDIAIANLEGPISTLGTPIPYKSSLRTSPYWISGIKGAGINLLNLANNHIYDYGQEAIDETLGLLNCHNINYVGYGDNLAASRIPKIIEIKGVKLAFLSYCSVVNKAHLYATDHLPGIPYCDHKSVHEDIAAAKASADIVIVSFHWGLENYNYPTLDQVSLAHLSIDSGASLVLGHHPHVLQGLEKYNNGIIVYSLGNFIFSDICWHGMSIDGDPFIFEKKWNHENRKSILFECFFNKNGIESYNIHHYHSGAELYPTLSAEVSSRNDEYDRISDQLGKDNYVRSWRIYTAKKELLDILVQVRSSLVKLITKPWKIRRKHIESLLAKIKVSAKVIKGKNAR